jgi:hypothetical protein
MWHVGIKAHRVFWGNRKERDHLEHLGTDGRVGNVELDLQELDWVGVDWINLVVGRDNLWVVNTLNVSLSSIKCGEFLEKPRNYSRRTLLHGVKELASSVGWLVWFVIETWYTNQIGISENIGLAFWINFSMM